MVKRPLDSQLPGNQTSPDHDCQKSGQEMKDGKAELKPVTARTLAGDNIRHGFFTRDGGVSDGIYRGLNVGIGSRDERDKVLENRHRVATHLDVAPQNLATLYQIHSSSVLEISRAAAGDRPKSDAMVTDTPGIAIGILTADCGPVLFADAESGIIGAAHAGWKGATGGILENTVTAMETLGARRENIRAVLGPTISQANYEVGPEFIDRLMALDPANDRWLAPSANEGHAMFDLPGYIVSRLQALGVAAEWTGECTYADEDRFFSYRRTTHRQEPDYGRQISAICLA